MTDWTRPIDAYCERTSALFWAEPLNAVSNGAFLVAATLALALWLRSPRRDRTVLFLVVLVFVIGLGSFLFHTFANRWSSLADVLPIAVFICVYFGFALRRFLGTSLVAAILGAATFIAGSVLAAPLLVPLAGSSASYVPAMLALYGVGGVLAARRRPASGFLLSAGIVFTLSIGWRMSDLPLCPTLPRGTHFLWHVFNAATLGLLLVAAIRHEGGARRRASGGA